VFLNKLIDIEEKTLSADKSALTVDKNFPVLKVQFLFTFLNISHLFVTDQGELVGVITKEDFIKKAMSMN
jgi:signal-transduction protein with cAMP-binding, CBS, and nucleotidyltransferase domain